MLILRLSKREDQALIPISTILKFSALVILRKSLKNRAVLVCLDQVTHTQGRTQEFAFGGLSFFQGGSAPAVREGRGGVSPQNPTMSAHTTLMKIGNP